MSRAIQLDEPGQLRVVPTSPASPAAGEALVDVAWSGICGSDLELHAGTRPAEFARYPVVPGHEWSGTVRSVGPDVDPGLVGRKAVGEGFRYCGRCQPCLDGDTTLCTDDYDETGFTRPGAWSDHLLLPARLLHVLHDTADLRAAALLEPASCMAAAGLKAAVQPGETAAVVGGGTLGLLVVQFLTAAGAKVTVVDPREERAEPAKRCGAGAFTTPDRVSGGFDVVVEAAGASGTGRLAVALTRRGGRVVLTGMAHEDAEPLPPADLVAAAITVHTVFGASSKAWSHAVRAFSAGLLDPEPLITHEYPLEDAERALDVLADPRVPTGKVLLHP
ncbi:alcohol dehydrogenase catalytic domain-containing protein [Saccharopolyspora halophila]|uniref:Alcohol dehydrogenase catalytic domain-containing protein n=2 Tax=Saccharopolyspora halophila TaxID=405551 RepID=A0ABN3GKR9_9PSEU